MRSTAAKAFELDDEKPAAVRDAYGRNPFGQGCLLARRLVERGVPFVEVTLSASTAMPFGWDTHQQNFDAGREALRGPRPGLGHPDGRPAGPRAARLDPDRLDGRVRPHPEDQPQTPAATTSPTPGPPCWPAAASRAARRSARPSADGMTVRGPAGLRARPPRHVVQGARASTRRKQNMSNVGRPIRLVDPEAKPIKEVLA